MFRGINLEYTVPCAKNIACHFVDIQNCRREESISEYSHGISKQINFPSENP